MQNEVADYFRRRRKVISENVRRRWIGRDSRLRLLSAVVGSCFRIRSVLSGEVFPLPILLLQPVQELGKLHLDAFDIRAELFEFRMNGLDLYGYVAGFFGEVFQVYLFKTIV